MKKNIDWLIIAFGDTVYGGAEQLQMQVTEYLIKENYNCTVYFLKRTGYGSWDHLSNKCNMVYSPFSNSFLSYLYIVPFIIKTVRNNHIHRTFSSQTLINSMLGLLKKLRILPSTKIIARESTSVFKQMKGVKAERYRMAYLLGYEKIDSVIFQTEIMKTNLLEEIPRLKNKSGLYVLKNPINIESIEKKSIIIPPFNVEKEFLVAAGRLADVKGFDILIRSFNKIKDIFPKMELWILGDGMLRDDLQTLINNLNIEDKVKLIGFVDNPYPYFKYAKACVISSRIEGFPNVLLQMMACNNKVVSTLCAGDIKYIDGVYKCQTENEDDLVKQICNSLNEDTEHNRAIFDTFLEKRNFKNYMDQILKM
tara:strand:+ start:36678 stop:37775 length:1098 start_codon:yes stop_codon:yes gene_type:complete